MNSCQTARSLHRAGFPIRIFPDHSLLPAPRDFSQVVTSFIASYHQGIHLLLFIYLCSQYSFSYYCSFPQYSSNCQRSKSILVGPDGLEPSTPRLSSACSNRLSYEPSPSGGVDRFRTDDLLHAKQALYQLSYDPSRTSNVL